MLAPAVGSGAPMKNGNSEVNPQSSHATHSVGGAFCEHTEIEMGHSALIWVLSTI